MPKVAGKSQNRSKIYHLKNRCRWFQLYFIDFQLFYLLTRITILYDFRIETMFGSSLPPVVCRKAHIVFTVFVFVCV